MPRPSGSTTSPSRSCAPASKGICGLGQRIPTGAATPPRPPLRSAPPAASPRMGACGSAVFGGPVFYGEARFRIQNLEFKNSESQVRAAACGGRAKSGYELRDRFCLRHSPQPGGRACNVEEQPSAQGRLRAAATSCEAANLPFNIKFGLQPAERTHVRVRTAGLRRRKAAARTAFSRPKFMIQNSRFKIKRVCRCTWVYIPIRGAACGGRTRLLRSCGPPPPGGCGPHGPTDRSEIGTSPLPSGRACDVEVQPSARGRLRPARS